MTQSDDLARVVAEMRAAVAAGPTQERREYMTACSPANVSLLLDALPVWRPIETAPTGVHVLACNAAGYVGRAIFDGDRWQHIGQPTGWMPLPAIATTKGQAT